MELINKADIEEILRNLWKQDDGHNSEHRICYNKALQEVQCKLDSLEVKNVNLKEEYIEEIQSHINGIRDKVDRMTSGNFMHSKAAIRFSANTIEKVLSLMGIVKKGE